MLRSSVIAALAITVLAYSPHAAQAARVRIEVDATVFSIATPGAGEIQLIEGVNGTSARLRVGDTIRAVFVYESSVQGDLTSAGTTGHYNMGVYRGIMMSGFGPVRTVGENPIMLAEFHVGTQRIMSTAATSPQIASATVHDSVTAGMPDYIQWAVSLPEPPPTLDGWGLALFLEEGRDLGSAQLPDTLPATGWRFHRVGDPRDHHQSWTWGVVSTSSTASRHAEFDAYVTAVRIGGSDATGTLRVAQSDEGERQADAQVTTAVSTGTASNTGTAAVAATTAPAVTGGSVQTTASGLAGCDRSYGTLAIREPEQQWWRDLQLESPEALIKVFVAESRCFTLVDRGEGLRAAQAERELAAGGDLRGGSNVGRGQMRAADYVLIPDIVNRNERSGNRSVGGLLGGALGGIVGAVAGGLSLNSKSADVVLTLTDVRSSEQVSLQQGHAEKADLSFRGGGFGFAGAVAAAGVSGYTNTEIGQVVTKAYMEAWGKMVQDVVAQQRDVQAENVQQAVTMASAGKLLATPGAQGQSLRDLSAGAMLFPTGEKQGPFWKVLDDLGNEGWVPVGLLELAK